MSREESANEDPFLDNTAASAPAYVVQAVEPRTITELSSSGRRRPGEGETGGPRNFNPDSRGGGDGVANGGGSPDGAGPGDVGRQGEQSTIPRPPRVSNSAPNLGGQQNQNQRPPPPPSQQQQAPPPRSRNLPPGKEVILAHFPSKRSNLTLEQFVRKICAYNRKVCPELAHDRREDVIRHNTTLLEGVELPEDVSPLEEADRDTPTDDEKQNTGTVARSTGSSKANKANGNHRGPSSVASQYAGTTSRSSTGVGRGMTPEMQEHLGMNTVAPQRRRKPKGIKLDFKDMAAVKPAIELLMRMNAWANVVCVWLNADVAAGPGFPPLGRNWVLDGRKFLQRCCRIPDVVLSLGWFSTELSATQQYTKTMIDDMLELVQRPFLRGKDSFLYTPAAVAHHITFCVQARFAVKSKPILKQLLELVPSSSLTIYTGFGSIGIAAQDLRAIEENFDTTRLFIDVWKHAEKEQNNKRAARITNGPGGRGGNNQDPNAARGAPDDGRAVTEKCSIM
ncbi:unnamed protein product [Amoebophrya sp. A25]|nr:unnamed protein product [Amoebophrya sp. A25]|eukprot:GSA25T00020630001.1